MAKTSALSWGVNLLRWTCSKGFTWLSPCPQFSNRRNPVVNAPSESSADADAKAAEEKKIQAVHRAFSVSFVGHTRLTMADPIFPSLWW
jgi:hypothetical protein